MKALSAAEAAKSNPKPKQENPRSHEGCMGACPTPNPQTYVKEHQMIPSRLGGRSREVSFGPLPNGLVPKNPFASLAQARFAHVHPEKFGGEKGLKEWDKSTDFSNIPKKK